jgi:N-acetylmuramoyl-L-alanine amidase
MPPLGVVVSFALVVLASACARPVDAAASRQVAVEVSADGVSLGRLTGELRGRIAYFALDDVARLVGGRLRRAASGDQATLTAPQGVVDLTRDRAQIQVDGRAMTLAAPVRAAHGRWQVPGDLLVRALPAVVGKAMRVTPSVVPSVPAAAARPAKSAPATASTPARPVTQPAPTSARLVPRTGPQAALPPTPAGAEDAARVPWGEREGGTPPSSAGDRPAGVTAPGPEHSRPAATAAAVGVPSGGSSGPDSPAVAESATTVAVLPLPPASALPGPPGPSAPAVPSPSPSSGELRYRSYPTYTRVVLEGETATEPRLVDTASGLVVTLPGLAHRGPVTTRAVRDGLVGGLELGTSRIGATLRVTFDRPPANRRVYRLDDPPRLVLDFYRSAPAAPGGAPAAEGLRVIVIDPGHGGSDPGALGPSGLQEKELTLDIARRVAALLQEDAGVRVLLTRSTDRFMALRERTTFANRERADLFVSIHANSAPAAAATGAETYFLSSEATDNAARQAAAAENRVIALEANTKGGASRDLLRSILWDLAQSDFQQESSRLAEGVQNTLDRALRLPSRGVKQAPFYVLGGAAMPAILVEVGFMTNPAEEQRLRDDGYRDRIARAIAAGLGGYKRNYDRRVRAVANQ